MFPGHARADPLSDTFVAMIAFGIGAGDTAHVSRFQRGKEKAPAVKPRLRDELLISELGAKRPV